MISLRQLSRAAIVLICVSFGLIQVEARPLNKLFLEGGSGTQVGVQVKIERFNPSMATEIRASGFRFVRFGMWINLMQVAVYRKQIADAFASARHAGLPVLLTVRSTVPLANPATEASKRNEQLRAAAGELVDVVNRTIATNGSNLLAIELWNEPDLAKYWPTGDIDIAFPLYMHEVCERLKRVHASTTIIGFGFATAPTPGSRSDRLLGEVLGSNPDCIDGVSYHAYGMNEQRIRSTSRYVRNQYQLPALITEWGISTAAKGGVVGQADGIDTFLSSRSSLQVPLVSIYEWQDTVTANNARERGFGLVTARGAGKPALDAVLKALSTP